MIKKPETKPFTTSDQACSLVTGATGFVGSHLTELLLEQGHEVICAVRDPSRLKHIERLPVKVAAIDALLEGDLPELLFDYVFHVAGATRAPDYETYSKHNVELTRRLLDFANTPSVRDRLKRFVLVSSQAVAGPAADPREPVTEDDPPRPVSLYAQSKLEAEELTRSYADRIPITIVRPSTVFGPRDIDVLGVFRSAKLRVAAHLPGPDRYVSIVYVKDLTAGILAAARSSEAVGRTYFLANRDPVIWKEFALLTARVMGYRAVALPLPT